MITNLKEKTSRLDALFSSWDKTTSPGCSLAVVHDGEIIYSRGYGMANLEHGIPNRPDTVFYIASTSKQFTASCIALCAEAGLLSLDDDVRKFVPELPAFKPPIAIRHLVHHTSGLRDFFELLSMRGLREDELLTNEDILHLLSHQRELNFMPGDEYLYSNSGYFLMGVIVERASGKSLRHFAQEHIFGPLGMKVAHFHDDHREPIPRRATG